MGGIGIFLASVLGRPTRYLETMKDAGRGDWYGFISARDDGLLACEDVYVLVDSGECGCGEGTVYSIHLIRDLGTSQRTTELMLIMIAHLNISISFAITVPGFLTLPLAMDGPSARENRPHLS